MKKCFRGYSVRQVDELITSLQNQNDDLVSKVTNLTMQLAAMDANFGGDHKTDALSKKVQELESRAEAEKKAFEDRIRDLSEKNNELIRMISDRGNSGSAVDASKVGEICSHAYADMAKIKEEVADNLVKQINDYTNMVVESNAQMAEALNSVEETYDDLLATVVEHLESIFTKLEVIDTGKDRIRNSILPVKDISVDLNHKIKELVEKSIRDQHKDELETLRKLGQEPVYCNNDNSPWESFKERRLKSNPQEAVIDPIPSSQRIIGIRANVAADDVFNSEAELA